ncbi:uncharacterized protein LOC112598268 isoform X2 [Melanaphis sacchari]|uniref:uncharacterized protein LOC112598268 isoform X2 n=1 Tax=Melanaphis sacchari TaxID=742174 RepID=UPI000DC1562D|nr:uncharacterized protein LOC112598268 isoform X2 [Melanaphis sacchari]
MSAEEWSSNGGLIVGTEDYKDKSSNFDEYSDFSYDHSNGMDWHFPVIVDLYQDSQWLLFENNFSLNELSVSEICYLFKNKVLCEFQTEIFLQHPSIIQKLIKWLNENKEKDLILECLNYLVEKLIRRHHECTIGLFENNESNNYNYGSISQISTREIYSESSTDEKISSWGIGKFCVTLMPVLLKHISFNSDGAFSLFMSNMHLLSCIPDNCNINFYIELVFSDYTIKNIVLNEPLASCKFLIITKEILKYGSFNNQFKVLICNILKQPYWIHLYPELYYQLYEKVIDEELLEQKIMKRVNDAYILSSTSNLNIKQYAQLFRSSLPVICFHKQFTIIDKFITNTCKYGKLTETTNDEKEYSHILLSLLSFESDDIVLYTYLALNNKMKKIFNHLILDSKKIDRLINNLLCTNVLNEIICFGCNNSNEQICQSASEIIEQIIKCKDIINNNQWKYLLNNLTPIFPVLCCYASQISTLGQMILDLFDPDQAEKLNISKLALLHSTIVMLFNKDNKSRIEANNRITWIFKTSLNKNIKLPNDIFVMEIDEVNEQVDKPIGEYNKKDLDDMIDLISNESSSHQTIKCALYKLSVILDHHHLQQHFIHNGGMDIILNLLKSSKMFVNERGLLIALLKLTLCFTKKKELIINDHNSLANNIEIQQQLILILSDFYEVPLVKQYVFQIFFYCIFKQYLTYFGEIPEVVENKINTPIKINKYKFTINNSDDKMLFSKIKENQNCMEVLILTWHLNHYDSIDVFLEDGLTANTQNDKFNNIFQNFRKASIKWSVKKYLVDLIAAKSHQVALAILSDLRRYLEISIYIEQFEVDEELLENALKKFLILPPIFLTDLQTLIVVLKLLNFALTKRVLISKLNWVAEVLMKSERMHHYMADDFKNDDKSKQLCNQFFIELYEVYWLCLKNYSHFSTLNLTKLLFDRLESTKHEIVLLQGNMKCLALLTENTKQIDKELVKMYLSQFTSLQTIVMNSSNEKYLQRSYLAVLNHILHHTIFIPNISEVWCMYDWETWTWSMIHNTDSLVQALVFQFSAGLAVIDVPVSLNLIHLAFNYFSESNYLENCVIAEQVTLFCSNLFCSPKFKSLCHQYISKLDFNAFIQIINLCSYYEYTKPEKNYFLTSPKLVSNVCCMLFNVFTLTEVNLYELDQHNQFVQALFLCLKKYLTPMIFENPDIMEMCGRICSILTLFIPVSSYNFENLLNSLNIIYERIDINLDHCTIMVWKSLFKLTTIVIQCKNYETFIITNDFITALLTSITSKNKDLCIEALNVISLIFPNLSESFVHHICNILIHTLFLEWHHKLIRKMLLIALSNLFLEHPSAYEIARQDNVLSFIISKLKVMQLQVTKQSNRKSKILQNEYLEVMKFCCNLFHGCDDAREDASTELPDLIHKLWPIVVANPKSDILICTLQMLVSLTSSCPSACSAMTKTSSTLGVDPKTKCTSYSLFHEIISLSTNFHLNEDVLNITLMLILNCCQAQECRVTITKSKLLSSIVLALNLKDKKRPIKIEQQCLKFLLVLTSYNEGQIHLLKVDYALDTLVDLLKSNYVNDSLTILRNLCFNGQNRVVILSSDVFLNGIKTLLENENLTDQNYKDISLAIWSIACNNQKARLQLRHWGIDKCFEKFSKLCLLNTEIKNIVNHTYQILKS